MRSVNHVMATMAAVPSSAALTPSMPLPGLAADYDNTGLGKLYQTSRVVAATSYGYDLTKYDFTYVCTAAKPAASSSMAAIARLRLIN